LADAIPQWAQDLIAKIEGTTLTAIRNHKDALFHRDAHSDASGKPLGFSLILAVAGRI